MSRPNWDSSHDLLVILTNRIMNDTKLNFVQHDLFLCSALSTSFLSLSHEYVHLCNQYQGLVFEPLTLLECDCLSSKLSTLWVLLVLKIQVYTSVSMLANVTCTGRN